MMLLDPQLELLCVTATDRENFTHTFGCCWEGSCSPAEVGGMEVVVVWRSPTSSRRAGEGLHHIAAPRNSALARGTVILLPPAEKQLEVITDNPSALLVGPFSTF